MTDNQYFEARLMGYLLLIGGPEGPQDSPINPKSHWRLLALFNEYGSDRVNAALDAHFEAHPNW